MKRIRIRAAAFATLAVLAAFAAADARAADPAQPQGTKLEQKPSSPPYSESIMSGDTLYVSGHIGVGADGKVPADPEAEARAVMDAVKQAVEKEGLTMDDLVSVTVYCSDIDLFAKFNGVYRSYFRQRFPTRAFIGVYKLLIGARFEVSGIAVRSPAPRKL